MQDEKRLQFLSIPLDLVENVHVTYTFEVAPENMVKFYSNLQEACKLGKFAGTFRYCTETRVIEGIFPDIREVQLNLKNVL